MTDNGRRCALGSSSFENEYENDFGDGGGADGIACERGSYSGSLKVRAQAPHYGGGFSKWEITLARSGRSRLTPDFTTFALKTFH